MANDRKIRGRMHLTVRSADGEVVAERVSRNIVVRGGAAIVARLFSGTPGALSISQVQVGFATDAGTAEMKSLTLPADAAIPLTALRSPLKQENFEVVTDQSGDIQVKINALFHPMQDLTDVTEAGLLAGEDLYNQVVFEPLALRTDQNITFFWQVNFPFGH